LFIDHFLRPFSVIYGGSDFTAMAHYAKSNYKDTHRNKPENYFLGWLTIMGVLLIEVAY
jgi:hypothetical protein